MGVHKLHQLLVADEASFAEGGATPTTAAALSFTGNIPLYGAPTFTPTHMRDPDGSSQPRLAVEAPGHPGARSGRLSFKTYWIGHLSSPTGALTQTWQQKLLADGLGGGKTDAAGTTLSAASSASSFTATAIGNWAAGYIGRVGAKGDTKGDAQPFVVGAVAGSVITALNALPATPANTDVLYGAQLAYHVEGATLTTKRFCLLFPDTGNQMHFFGCQLASIEFDAPVGGKPTITWTYEVAYHQRATRSFPDATTLGVADCATFGGGSIFINDVGTTTRATLTAQAIGLTMDLGLSPIEGPGGAGDYQYIVGWTRTNAKASIMASIPWVSTYETWWDTANQSLVYKHILAALNVGNGRSIGFYAPRCFPMGQRPNATKNINDQTYVDVAFGCTESLVVTNDLTRSALRLFAS